MKIHLATHNDLFYTTCVSMVAFDKGRFRGLKKKGKQNKILWTKEQTTTSDFSELTHRYTVIPLLQEITFAPKKRIKGEICFSKESAPKICFFA